MNCKLINQGLTKLSKVISKRPKHPILACVHLRSDGHILHVAGTNLTRFLTVQIPTTLPPFECVTGFQILKRILAHCEDVRLSVEGDRLVLQGDSFEYRLTCYPVDQYPCLLGSEIITLPLLKQPLQRSKPKSGIIPHETSTVPINPVKPAMEDAIVPFIRPYHHPELGTLEPDCLEATEQLIKQLRGEIPTPMPDYVISLEEMKKTAFISLPPAEAYNVICGNKRVILMPSGDGLEKLLNNYLIVHSAYLDSQEELEANERELLEMDVNPEFATPGTLMGYVTVTAIRQYNEASWKADQDLHDYELSLAEMLKELEVEQLWGVVLEHQMMLSDPVFEVPGGVLETAFWYPSSPHESAWVRQVFESDRVVVDIERELEPELT